MKKIKYGILGILSIFLISPVFADTSQNFFRSFNVTSGGLDYLCYVGSYHSQVGNTTSHRSSSINCGSFNIDHTFNYSFSIFPELSGYTYTLNRNYYTSSFFYFISGAVHYKLYTYNQEILFDKSFPVGSKSVNLSSQTLSIKNLKINSNLGSFLGFNTNLTNNQNGGLYGSLYNQYYFTGFNWLYNTGILNSFYSPDIAISSVYYDHGYYILNTIFDDGFTTDINGKFTSFNSISYNVLTIPLLSYGYNYLTGSKTLLFNFYGGNLIYNLLDCYSNQSRILSGCSIIDKGYLNNYVDLFNGSGFSVIGNLSTYSSKNTFYTYYDDGFLDVYFSPMNVVTRSNNDINSYIGLTKRFKLISDSSVPDINITYNNHGIGSLNDLCNDSIFGTNPLCFKDFSGSWSDLSQDSSGNVWLTIYDDWGDGSGPCDSGYFIDNDGKEYFQYLDTGHNLCLKNYNINSYNSAPYGGEYSEFFSGSDLTGLENNINFAFSGIVGSNFKFYSCPFKSPLRALHLSSIGSLSSFLLDKFFDVNLVGPFNCLLGGILYSETDSTSLGSRLLSGSYSGVKYFNNFSDDVKNTINWLLFAGMVLFFWSFRPKEH